MKQEPITSTLQNYAHEVWLASLGTFRKIQTEGNRLLDGLVKQGEPGKARSKEVIETKAEAKISHQVKVEAKRSKIAEYQNRLERILQSSVTHALKWLNMVNGEDIRMLSKCLDTLEASIRELERVSKPRPSVTKH
jgi:poly(hydroxyalkanoate) granule-associated protein